MSWWDDAPFEQVGDLAYAELFQDGFIFDDLAEDPGHMVRRIITETLRNTHFIEIRQQRDEGRELADRLAEVLTDTDAKNPAHTYEHQGCGLCLEEKALDAYEKRSWA